MIEHSLGHADQARSLLTAALETNPHFNPLQAGVARRTLDQVGPAAGRAGPYRLSARAKAGRAPGS